MSEPLADRIATLKFVLKTHALKFSISEELIDELVIHESFLDNVLSIIARVRIPTLVGESVRVPVGWRDYLLHGLKSHPRWGTLVTRLTRRLPVYYRTYEASCMIPDLPHAQRAFEMRYALFTGFQTTYQTENEPEEEE